MKRLAIGIALGLVVNPITGCDKKDTKDDAKPGDAKSSGPKSGDAKPAEATKGEAAGAEDSGGAAKGLAAMGSAADAMKYVPDGANLVIGVDAAKIAQSPIFQSNQDLLKEGESGELMTAADGCKVGLGTWKYVVVAGDTEKEDGMIALVSAAGLGKKDTLECVGKKIKEAHPEESFDVGEEGGRVVVQAGDDAKLYAVSDDLIAWVGPDYDAAVQGLLKGEGKTATSGSLKDVLAELDQSAHIYFGLKAAASMQSGPTEGLKHLLGSVALSEGLALRALADFGAPEKATAMAAEANKQFEAMKGMAAMIGIPAPVIESVKIEAKDKTVVATAKATAADVKAMSESAKRQMAGKPAAAAPPPGAH